MQRQNVQETGWGFVADREAAAEVFAALLELDDEKAYTMTDLAEAADVPLKTLYVSDWLDDLRDLGVLEAVDPDSDDETAYSVNADSDLLAAARAFDETFADVAGE